MRIPRLLIVPAALIAFVITGCAPTSADPGESTGGGSGGSGGTESGGGTDAGALTCDDADLSGGWDLFVDPALTVDPAGTGPTSLQTADDAIHFSYAAEEFTTYGYELGYIDDGTVFPNDSGVLFADGHPDAPDDNVFTIVGPMAPSGVDGGPYAGVLQISATTLTGSTYVASICVVLATSD